MQKLMIIFAALVWGLAAQAQSIDTIVEITAPAGKSLGQKEVFDRAIEKVSNQFIEQLIGESKATKNQTLIKNRIVKNSGKYIVFIRAQNPVVGNEGTRYPVSMKISTKTLETLLLQEGLLYRTEGPP